jgi:VanZ family protein
MAFIFFLSHQQTTGISGTRIERFFLFKTLHLIEYAILFLLSLFSFSHQALSGECAHALSRSVHKKHLLQAFLFSWIYAFTDEFHQYLVPGRTAQLTDTLFDLAGISIGILIYLYLIPKKLKIRLTK